ncbi:MAG: glycine--tRNA ligase subunit beta [Deltaproteobacteria bacterium]
MSSRSQKSKVKGRHGVVPKESSSPEPRTASPETRPLLVEIGCEEIPARFLNGSQADFGAALAVKLRETRLLRADAPSNAVRTFSTPRRLVAFVPAVLYRQPDQVEEVTGPPAKVTWDADGKPTRAAESFAQKNGVSVKELTRVITPKGEYAATRKTTKGLPADEILSRLIPATILGMNFPKSMYWEAKSGPRFIRPIRWVVALLGEGKQARVVPFKVIGVKSSDSTTGHRIESKPTARVSGFGEYVKALGKLHVEVDPATRRERVREECEVLLERTGWRIVPDPILEDWIVNSTEWPKGLVGKFDERFLKLPREILITVMRDHQHYFAVEDGQGRLPVGQGKLQSSFLTVMNVPGDPKGLIRAGHERVLTARFSDAEFFWDADQKTLLSDRMDALNGVTYQADLGSYAEKVRRMKGAAKDICRLLDRKIEGFGDQQQGEAIRAVELSKCDLATQMVGEFPELQGIVGGLYAAAQGEPQALADAIYDHYRPESTEDSCPRSIAGAVVSLSDKLDSVASGFAVGLEPTGSSDPFALRRAGNGIVKVLVELALPINLRTLVQQAINSLNVKWARPQVEVFASVVAFLEDRLRYYLESVCGLRYDTVRAVLAAGWDVPADAARRAAALEKIRDSADFEALFVAAKRIKNILAKSAGEKDWQPGEADAALLEAGEEKALAQAFAAIAGEAEKNRQSGDYEPALKSIARLRQPVDRFFDKVLVMAEDPRIRENRLRLLAKLDGLFSGMARFSEIAPANVGAPTKVKAVNEK